MAFVSIMNGDYYCGAGIHISSTHTLMIIYHCLYILVNTTFTVAHPANNS